jgi:hypothetical protein
MKKSILIPTSVSLLTAALLLSPNAVGQVAPAAASEIVSVVDGYNSAHMFQQAIFAKGYVTLSSDAEITGNVFAGAATTIGANAKVYGGTINSGAATTLGAGVTVKGGDVISGAATTLGATSFVEGGVTSGAATTIGAGAVIYRQGIDKSYADSSASIPAPTAGDLELAQENLYDLGPNFEAVTHNIGTDVTWLAGVTQIEGSLSVSAGVTLTLDGSNSEGVGKHFIINVRDYVSFGAGAKVELKNGQPGARVIWNVKGTYISLGALADIEGSLLANTYIATGADSVVSGGAYSATSYVFAGATAKISN